VTEKFATVEEFQDHMRERATVDEEFRARLLADPKAVMEEELDMSIPDGFNILVHEDTATTAHLVIPPSASLAAEDLQAVAGGVDWSWCTPV